MADVYVPVSAIPTLLYTPASSNDRVRIANAGQTTVFLGQSAVTAATGLPLRAGSKPILLTSNNGAIYGVAAPVATGTPSGTTSAALAAGVTGLTVASGGASFTQGSIILLDTGAKAETLTVGAGSGATNIVVNATQFPHATGATIVTLTGSCGTSVHVTSGTG